MNRVLTGIVKEIRPLPVLATFAALELAFVIAGNPFPQNALGFFTTTFFLMYTVHVLDTYEDAFVRKEDAHKTFRFAHGSEGELQKKELLMGAIVSSLLFFISLFLISPGKGVIFPALVLFGYLIGVLYSALLSKKLFTSLFTPPFTVFIGMMAAFLFAGGGSIETLFPTAISVFWVMLGGKVLMDVADQKADAYTKRENVAQKWGEKNALTFSVRCMFIGMAFSLVSGFSVYHLIGLFLPAILWVKGFSLPSQQAVHLVMPGIFVFLLVEIAFHFFL